MCFSFAADMADMADESLSGRDVEGVRNGEFREL